MDSGLLTSETFSTLLRTISQRRRQGVLEIDFPSDPVRILFVQGKIVEVVRASLAPAHEVVQRLQRAGLLPAAQTLPLDSYHECFQALQSLPVAAAVDLGTFKRVVKHRILDVVYTLDFGAEAGFSFNVQMVEYEKDFAPTITTAQVLLDMVALQTDRERYQGLAKPGNLVKAVPGLSAGLSEEERLIYELCPEGMHLEDLRTRSMLSAYHFQESVFSLLDHGLLSVVAMPARQVGAEDLFGLEVLSALDSSIDRTFASESGITAGELPEPPLTEAPAPEEAEAGIAERVLAIESGLKTALHTWSGQLLQRKWVPHVVSAIFVLAAVLIPMFFWRELFVDFSKR